MITMKAFSTVLNLGETYTDISYWAVIFFTVIKCCISYNPVLGKNQCTGEVERSGKRTYLSCIQRA
jgi:hypothetical protein